MLARDLLFMDERRLTKVTISETEEVISTLIDSPLYLLLPIEERRSLIARLSESCYPHLNKTTVEKQRSDRLENNSSELQIDDERWTKVGYFASFTEN